MFRAYSYMIVNGTDCRLTTGPVETAGEADNLLIEMQARGLAGGDIEQYVPGIGWVLAEQAESAVLIRNRQEADIW